VSLVFDWVLQTLKLKIKIFFRCIVGTKIYCKPCPKIIPFKLSLPKFFSQLILFSLIFSLMLRHLQSKFMNSSMLAPYCRFFLIQLLFQQINKNWILSFIYWTLVTYLFLRVFLLFRPMFELRHQSSFWLLSWHHPAIPALTTIREQGVRHGILRSKFSSWWIIFHDFNWRGTGLSLTTYDAYFLAFLVNFFYMLQGDLTHWTWLFATKRNIWNNILGTIWTSKMWLISLLWFFMFLMDFGLDSLLCKTLLIWWFILLIDLDIWLFSFLFLF
jgi:hypothetical protein